MKKTDFKENDADNFELDDMLPEYRFDYRKARPNRFTAEVVEGSMICSIRARNSTSFQNARSR